MLPQFYRNRDGKPPFAANSFADVIAGKVQPGRYANKIVLIHAGVVVLCATFPAPGSTAALGRRAGLRASLEALSPVSGWTTEGGRLAGSVVSQRDPHRTRSGTGAAAGLFGVSGSAHDGKPGRKRTRP